MTTLQQAQLPSQSLISRIANDRRLPYIILCLLTALFVFLTPVNDHSRVFFPAGQLILHGANPYPLATGYFLYWPFSFWFFPLMALHPAEYYLLYTLNVVLLIVITRRLEISAWWCLYPPALFTIIYGQIDILILFLMVEAYRRNKSPLSILLVALAASVKPQTTIFWVLPWLWTLPTYRLRFSYALAVGLVLLVPMAVAFLLAPQMMIQLWQDCFNLMHQTSSVYVGNSLSLWSLGLILPGIAFLILSIVFSRNHRISRPMMALGMPAMGYYTSVVLMGALPTWGLLVAYGTIALTLVLKHNFFWIEPLVILVYYLWLWWRARSPKPA
jgi:hypothetical protein